MPATSWWRFAATAPVVLAAPAAAGPILLAPLLSGVAAWSGGVAEVRTRHGRQAARAAEPWSPSQWCEAEGRVLLRITAWPRRDGRGGWTAPAAVIAWRGDDGPRRGEGLILRAQGEPPALWGVLVADAVLRPPRQPAVDAGFDDARYLAGRGLRWRGHVADETRWRSVAGGDVLSRVGVRLGRGRDRILRVFARGLPPREAALAGAILLGAGSDPALRAPFVRLGLAHLFALSGLHVGLIAGLAALALRPLARGPRSRAWSLGPLLAVYAVLVSMPGSVTRATGLAVVALGAPVVGRRGDSLRTLGLLFWANAMWEPLAVLDTGLRLSYLAAAGIVGGHRLLAPYLRSLAPVWRAVAGGLVVTLAAQTATLVEVAASFGRLNLCAPLVNLVAVPVFSLAVAGVAGGAVVRLVWPWAADGALACGAVLLRLLAAGASRGAQVLGFAEIGLPAFDPPRLVLALALACGLGLVLHRGQRGGQRRALAAAAVVVAALIAVAAHDPLAAHRGVVAAQFAVGQGDCGLLRLPDDWTVLIDTGDAGFAGPVVGRDVVPWLVRRGLRHLDAVMLTHGHLDHTGGAARVGDAFPVGTWILGGDAQPPEGAPGSSTRPVAGDTLHAAGPWAVVCLHPPAVMPPDAAENDRSLAIGLLRAGMLVGLWTGDLETAGEARLVPALAGVPAAGIDYWKAGHHGSRTSGSAALVRAVRPRLIALSCGVANRHRHPSHGPYVVGADTLATVRTDLDGTLIVRWTADGRGRWRTVSGRRGAWPQEPGRTGASLDTIAGDFYHARTAGASPVTHPRHP